MKVSLDLDRFTAPAINDLTRAHDERLSLTRRLTLAYGMGAQIHYHEADHQYRLHFRSQEDMDRWHELCHRVEDLNNAAT